MCHSRDITTWNKCARCLFVFLVPPKAQSSFNAQVAARAGEVWDETTSLPWEALPWVILILIRWSKHFSDHSTMRQVANRKKFIEKLCSNRYTFLGLLASFLCLVVYTYYLKCQHLEVEKYLEFMGNFLIPR